MYMLPQIQAEIDSPDRGNKIGSRRIGRKHDVTGFQTKHEMGHGRISGKNQVRYVIDVHPAHIEQFFDESVDRADDHFLNPLQTARFLGVQDPCDNVFAVTDLCIIIGGFSQGYRPGAPLLESSIRR